MLMMMYVNIKHGENNDANVRLMLHHHYQAVVHHQLQQVLV
jgi:hypothetical protein